MLPSFNKSDEVCLSLHDLKLVKPNKVGFPGQIPMPGKEPGAINEGQ